MVYVVKKLSPMDGEFMNEVVAMLRKNHPADELQQLPAGLHWAVADGGLLFAISSGKSIERGPRGRALYRLFRLARRLRQEASIVFLVGLVEVLRLCWRQGRVRSGLTIQERIFVGFGAAAEEALFGQYQAESEDSVVRLDQAEVGTLGAFHTVGWIQTLKTLRMAHRRALEAVASVPGGLKPWRLDFLTSAGMRLGQYSYMRTWFADVRISAPQLREVCFLSADTPAFAAVDTGLPTRYLQHGLIRRSIVLPNFDVIDALTFDEREHFSNRIPTARVRFIKTLNSIPPSLRGQGVLIASHHESAEEMERMVPLLDWFESRGIPIVVRPHPQEDRAFWRAHGSRWSCVIDDSDRSFMLAVKRLHPRFIVSWYSTALVDALEYGILPITVSHAGNQNIQDLVYQLFDRAIHWPRDAEMLAFLLNDDQAYGHVLTRFLEAEDGR
jgi:hypothetical protein